MAKPSFFDMPIGANVLILTALTVLIVIGVKRMVRSSEAAVRRQADQRLDSLVAGTLQRRLGLSLSDPRDLETAKAKVRSVSATFTQLDPQQVEVKVTIDWVDSANTIIRESWGLDDVPMEVQSTFIRKREPVEIAWNWPAPAR